MSVTRLTSHEDMWPYVVCASVALAHHSSSAPGRLPVLSCPGKSGGGCGESSDGGSGCDGSEGGGSEGEGGEGEGGGGEGSGGGGASGGGEGAGGGGEGEGGGVGGEGGYTDMKPSPDVYG